MLIGQDLTSFISLVRQLELQGHTLALFKDTGGSKGELHTGVVVMFRGSITDQCLQAWGKKLTGLQIGNGSAQANQPNHTNLTNRTNHTKQINSNGKGKTSKGSGSGTGKKLQT